MQEKGGIMQITSRFSIAVHTLLVLYALGDRYKTTSEFIASSVNVNPVVIRRTLGALKEAGLIEVRAGSGGARIVRDADKISLYDVYRSVDCVENDLFRFHEHPNPNCPVGKSIHRVLDGHLADAQRAMEDYLKSVTLADLGSQYRAPEKI